MKTYSTPIAFKTALEHRLRTSASDSARDFNRCRQLMVFDRFLARVVQEFGEAVVLKGGLVLELRLQEARTTKDVDIRVSSEPDQVLTRLQAAGRLTLGDFMSFEVRPQRQPKIQGDGVRYEGIRFRVECKIAGKVYAVFGMDVGVGDPMISEPEEMIAVDWLGFAGIAPPRLRLYPVETHLAEKLHAYTMPRSEPNSRIKDLPDIALLARVGPLMASRVAAALEQTFTFRRTHEIPSKLPLPPVAWRAPYATMAEEFELRWKTLAACHEYGCRFVDPVLAGARAAKWDPMTWAWVQDV